jgi:hypothetical protein
MTSLFLIFVDPSYSARRLFPLAVCTLLLRSPNDLLHISVITYLRTGLVGWIVFAAICGYNFHWYLTPPLSKIPEDQWRINIRVGICFCILLDFTQPSFFLASKALARPGF